MSSLKFAPTGRVADLLREGQSLWLDSISRHLMDSGELDRLINETGVRGITSNPTIFEKAINGSSDYDADIVSLSAQGLSASEIEASVSWARRGLTSIETNPSRVLELS